MQTEHSCCFTGHRLLPDDAAASVVPPLEEAIARVVACGVTRFYAGGAQGFDTLAAETVLRLTARYPHLQLHLLLPFPQQDLRWPAADRARFRAVRERAATVSYTADAYAAGCFQQRDRQLVDHCRYCIAYGCRDRGGTAYTLRYARQRGLTVINLASPAEQLSFFLP